MGNKLVYHIKINRNFNPNNIYKYLGVDNYINRTFNYMGKKLVKQSKADMKKQKHGIKYVSLPFRSSAKGEALASQSGNTRRSIKYKTNGHKYMDFGSNAKTISIWEGKKNTKYNNRPTLTDPVNKIIKLTNARFRSFAKKKEIRK